MGRQPFVRFVLVGGVNTGLGYVIFSLCILLGLHFTLATLLSTALGVLFNFITTGKIVFHNDDPKLLFRFILVYGLLYLMNIGFLKLLLRIPVSEYAGQAILVLPLAVFSYFLNKNLVFKR